MISLFRGGACLSLVCWVLLAWAAGCTKEVHIDARTQVLLRIEPQSQELLERFTTLRVVMARREGEAWKKGPDVTFQREDIAVWPVELPVTPGAKANETAQFQAVVQALEGDLVLAEARAVTTFVRNSWRVLTLRLEPCPGRPVGTVCAAADCDGPSCEVCDANGECVPVGLQPGDRLPEQATDTVMGSAAEARDRDGAAIDASDLDAGRDGGDTGTAQSVDGAADTVQRDSEVDASSPAVEIACEEQGLLRCVAPGSAARQRCEQGAWIEAEPCDDQQVCDPQAAGACRQLTAVCAGSAGKAVCDVASMHLCGELGDAERTLSCASENHCQRGLASGACAICLEGEHRCEAATLQVCSDDGQSFRPVETCESAALCNEMTGSCTPGCAPGAKVCDGDTLRVCKSDLTTFEDEERCGTGLCDEAGKECDVCVPMSKKCEGNVVSTCNADGRATTTQACVAPRGICTGNGVCVECTTAQNCAVPASECRTATCNAAAGTCGTIPKQRGAPCASGVCDGSGACVPCLEDSDCTTAGRPRCTARGCVSKIAGSAITAGCSSYGRKSGAMCAGFFCGVTEADIEAELNSAVCPGLTGSLLCSGELTADVASCMRNEKSANPLLADDQLRPEVAACVYAANAAYRTTVPMNCLDCFLDGSMCMNRRCLVECLAGDSAGCDKCRRDNGCDQQVMSCAQLPSPF